MTWDELEKKIASLEKKGTFFDSKIRKAIEALLLQLDTTGGQINDQSLSKAFNQLDKTFKDIILKDFKEFKVFSSDIVKDVVQLNLGLNKDLKLTRKGIMDASNLDLFGEEIAIKFSELGIKENVLIPMKKIILNSVSTGKGISTLQNEFTNLFDGVSTSNGRSMTSYTRQVANDVVNATNGNIQLHIRDKYGLQKLRYVGSEKDNTRPICSHLLDMKQPIELSEVSRILNEYKGSHKLVENNAGKMVKKGGGILGNATLDTFILGIATPNCRHRRLLVR
jgi:hypothetical protein